MGKQVVPGIDSGVMAVFPFHLHCVCAHLLYPGKFIPPRCIFILREGLIAVEENLLAAA
jgi:hypothetical protein